MFLNFMPEGTDSVAPRSTRRTGNVTSSPSTRAEEEKQRRLDELMEAQRKISLAHNQALVGETLEVMVDCLDEDGYSYLGRTAGDAPDIDNAVIFAPLTAHEPGEIVRVRILDGFDYDLEGMEVES